ncbi:hypothetical protein Tco_1040823 [Tanacetum coccineum]|uniref:Uncharacterized protein n=1 Tax=Tanacetum coccineum TaxID=301880 RepID=A0ABQ5GEH4_9ASTR
MDFNKTAAKKYRIVPPRSKKSGKGKRPGKDGNKISDAGRQVPRLFQHMVSWRYFSMSKDGGGDEYVVYTVHTPPTADHQFMANSQDNLKYGNAQGDPRRTPMRIR